jgi:hypothetical protein
MQLAVSIDRLPKFLTAFLPLGDRGAIEATRERPLLPDPRA